MRVLHITNLYPEKGNVSYGIFVKEQIDSLRTLGVDCEVLFINAARAGKAEYFRKIAEIKRRSTDFDLIHCHHTYAAFCSLFFAGVRPPVITSFLTQGGRDGKSNHFYYLKRCLYRYAQRHSDFYIIKDSRQADPAWAGKEACIPNGVDLDLFREIPRSEALAKLGLRAKKYILFCSSTNLYRSEKRYDLFRRAVQIVKSKYDQEVEELAVENEARERMPHLFNAAAAHLLTSDFEGSPNSVKEALACNTPVVARDVGNVSWMLGPVAGCYVSESADPHVLAELIHQAISRDKVAGRQRLIDLQLDMGSVAAQIQDIYTRALGRKSA
ncbi:MAG: glycosyltransferase family 4 protein [Deltaproteobacteria bacterium]|nr:glycosyltransferase family 4 protein [Deltaproteobacteria bacterium]